MGTPEMLGLTAIGSYVPPHRVSNYDRQQQFGIDESFIETKLGVRRVAIKEPDQESSDLCVEAFRALTDHCDLRASDIDAVAVVTQNPDLPIPHTSAIVHAKLGLSAGCAVFDVSLGCSGFVHGWSILQGFMRQNGLTNGVLFTADPYSRIVDQQDKNTALLFGDAATASWISPSPRYLARKFSFGTMSGDYRDLICSGNRLCMNGRGIFNFAARHVPADIRKLVAGLGLTLDQVDRFIFHQGSKFIVDTLAKSLALAPDRVAFDIFDYGNTVSSSIPILLEQELRQAKSARMIISGFGVGLAWASALLERSDSAFEGTASETPAPVTV